MPKQHTFDATKIVATIGPASDSIETLKDLIHAGVNVARLNTKHGTPEWHSERIDRIRQASKELNEHVGILLDLQGPEIRINVPEHKEFPVPDKEQVWFVSEFTGKAKEIQIPQDVIESLKVGDTILLEDGACEFKVSVVSSNEVIAISVGDSVCRDRKTMNLPGVVVQMPSLIPEDIVKLDMLKEHPVDFVALSFVRDQKDIEILQSELTKRNLNSKVVAKIENQAAVDNLDEIIQVSDAVMVARGDLGVEIPMEQLASQQKRIIDRARFFSKPVITATEMLKSMVERPRPTRAEICDVANAVFDGTDAVMLSEETAMGKYPVAAVATMRRIARYNEPLSKKLPVAIEHASLTSAITLMLVSLIQSQPGVVDKVVILTQTGNSAKDFTRHHCHIPVLVLSDQIDSILQSTLLYSARPIFMSFPDGPIGDASIVITELKKLQGIKTGERVAFIHGPTYKHPGSTNSVFITEIV